MAEWKFCIYCGRKISADSRFCTHCGREQSEAVKGKQTKKTGLRNLLHAYTKKFVQAEKEAEKPEEVQESIELVECASCGRKEEEEKVLRLADHSSVCSECTNRLPASLYTYAAEHWDLNEFNSFQSYVRHSDERLAPVFEEDAAYCGLRLDTGHALLAYKTEKGGPDLYFYVKNLSDCRLEIALAQEQPDLAEKLLHGDIMLKITSVFPSFEVTKVLDKNRILAMSDEGDRVYLPEEAAKFNSLMLEVIENLRKGKYEEKEKGQEQSEGNEASTELHAQLQSALDRFFFRSLEDVTMAELRRRRNKLIKSFHPDGGEEDQEAAQMINAAFDLLRQYAKD